MDAYEYLAKDEELNELFNRTMYHETTIVMKKILNKYKGFDGLKVVVDIGGGIGTNISLINISNYWVAAGVEHVGGDMFLNVPKGDAIFMKLVLHNWKDGECITLLKKCHEALPEGGKVIVVEGIVPVVPEPDNATRHVYGFDIMMMTTKAKERTEKEFEVLAKESGFATYKRGRYSIVMYSEKLKAKESERLLKSKDIAMTFLIVYGSYLLKYPRFGEIARSLSRYERIPTSHEPGSQQRKKNEKEKQ
ncbi:hypothetical protein Syun_025139 [Stephania yunnanensis]|uniref:O-methyltransferase C-terminal domain-containing protein n=1 Tax=Stephania yunnanensis TaxID=152371 RepID=A0AAP0EZX3_9MAGN